MIKLVHPCPGARISQRFGENPEWYAPFNLPGHEGVDFAVPVGTPIRAPISGKLVANGHLESAYGLHVDIKSDELGGKVVLAHLSAVLASGTVEAGQIVALSGNTGRSTGPHLHLALWIRAQHNSDYFGYVDPLPFIGKEAFVGPSKISWHVQTLAKCKWLKAALADSPIEWLKIMDPPERNDCPVNPDRVNVIGRVWIGGDDVEMDQFIVRGQAGAEAYFERCREAYERAPYVYAWEGPNEPFMGDPAKRAALIVFTIAWANIMHTRGMRVVGGSFAVGWPDWPDVVEMIPMAKACDLMGYHGYSAPFMTDRYAHHALRYRGIIERWADAGFDSPPWLLTETGIDGGVQPVGCARTGWRTWAQTWNAYRPQLQWLDQEMANDPLMLAAFVYTLGAEQTWWDFELKEPEVRDFTAWQISVIPAPREPLPMDETATDPATLADKCRWWMEEMRRARESGRPDRADEIHLSLIQLHYRLEETLKS